MKRKRLTRGGGRRRTGCLPTGRSGAALVMALVALALTGLFAAALVETAVMERGLVERRERAAQARWLAESGVERAAAQIAADATYAGETWRIADDPSRGRGPASVYIEVEAAAASAGARRIRIRAEYPSDASQRRRASHLLNVELPPEGDTP